jgi:hypothetical protein
MLLKPGHFGKWIRNTWKGGTKVTERKGRRSKQHQIALYGEHVLEETMDLS